MPIKGLSEQRRMPRLGKIHLGIKAKNAQGVEYPKATDYFVVPDEIKDLLPDKPKQLSIMIPVEDEEYWASQYYRCYSRTRGLVCKGDGGKSYRMVDTKTGDMANRDSTEIAWHDAKCDGHECPFYKNKQCREVMNLQFLLPNVPGVGVWQIDTSSINSIRNINSSAELIRGICGRIRMIPLQLTLEKQEVVNPDDGKKKNVCVLNLSQSQTLQSLLADSLKPVHELLAPAPADNEAPLDVAEETPVERGQEADGLLDGDKPVEEPPDKTLTIQAFYNWLTSHGKAFTRTWFLKTFTYTEEDMKDPEKIKSAYAEVKEIQAWTE